MDKDTEQSVKKCDRTIASLINYRTEGERHRHVKGIMS